jgi:beta-N-acetylhexosaminidase
MVATNDPIGHWGREYGNEPPDVATYGVAFERGMRSAGVAVAIKHFPGLGRVTGNTDFTAQGIVDEAFVGADDPYLRPFRAGIEAGAEFVMISLASYPRADPRPAVFSSVIIEGILRGTLGFQSIVLTDDVGQAQAVAGLSPAERALSFLRAGGDMVLTVKPSDIAPMTQAVLQATAADAAFNGQVSRSIDRVLQLKSAYGLLPG